VAVLNGGKTLIISNDSDFGIDGLTNATPPFQLHLKASPATGKQDEGEFLVIDLTKFPAATSTTTVSLAVNPSNKAPSFVKGPAVSVVNNAGAISIPGWATSISAGAGESSQTVTFVVTNNNNALFSVQPTIAANGTLTFTPAPGAKGQALVTVSLKDNGGTA